ncbi:TPA: hypothetical protein L5C15_005759 [Pseudomonas aeruginosa]|uniref:hypothetical protein n=1 Tax=Pseudomonas aeruginosa TaxID=287 RepID=UPI000940F916|nr:hypothetical protein [Pseudomonas aeruginosa]OKS40415.1 hypothetical protein BH608_01670 [Pseudomonas aeruginosa]HBO7934622.1 hypothetical protein [Pseudomonas aeruginosa]HBO8188564.1 hypothetical protein [Pseudomonas aeruginosa]HBO8713813.1 hypothetical protein [Pseudomonas aeruginosa]HCF2449063.1 hypothetical protein [Pseudomonas aeruginosa]
MLTLAPRPTLDLALLDLQARIEDQVTVMIEMGDADLYDLDRLVARADEYSVMADSGKVALCRDTVEELAERAGRIKKAVREHQAERRQALKELQNELDA